MSPQIITGIIVFILFAFITGGFIGKNYSDGQYAKQQVVVLTRDAKEIPKIEKKDHDQEIHDVKTIEHAKVAIPQDCFNQPISDESLRLLSSTSD